MSKPYEILEDLKLFVDSVKVFPNPYLRFMAQKAYNIILECTRSGDPKYILEKAQKIIDELSFFNGSWD